jgi:Phage integrase family
MMSMAGGGAGSAGLAAGTHRGPGTPASPGEESPPGAGQLGVETMRRGFPPRPPETSWHHTRHTQAEILQRLDGPAFRADRRKTQVPRLRGARKFLDWLATFPGSTWQQRWLASGQEESPGADWSRLPAGRLTAQGESAHAGILGSGLFMLICADVIRPSAAWLISRGSCTLATGIARYRDAAGFAALDRVIAADPAIINANAQPAKARIAVIVASKGGLIADITVGDCVEFYDAHSRVRPQGAPGKNLFYVLLHRLGIFGADAPATLRALCGPAQGQLSATGLVDRCQLRPGPIRDLIIDYLTERRPSLDYSTLNRLALELAGLFWADLEHHHPGIASLHLSPEVAIGWKERLKTKTRMVTDSGTGTRRAVSSPRNSAAGVLSTVRAFYLDIAQWALEEPARWGPWAAPCPVKETELSIKKEKQAVKARMDQRTRERLPVLPALIRTANELRKAAAERLAAAQQAQPGGTVTVGGHTLRVPIIYRTVNARVWAEDIDTGIRRDLTLEESDAFWAWAVIEVLSRTGIRIEELLELTHQAITSYRLPSTGELVPLLQIVPSKTGIERLLLVDPELADVLSAIICRIRMPSGAVPLVPAYDYSEKTWMPPMGLLFQRTVGGEKHAFSPRAIYQTFTRTLSASGLTGTGGNPLRFTPHDFRRIFITDAIVNGLPPHIAQIIVGHATIATTMGYKAIYPVEALEAHRSFVARRRAIRSGEEYRTPTDDEWDAFLAHFERRKLSVGTCARAFNTPCIHEHACVRCPMLKPDPAQQPRLEEIRDNLEARITEAKREGWLGEIEGLQVSLVGAKNKLAQLDASTQRRAKSIELGIPSFTQIAGRTGTLTGPLN